MIFSERVVLCCSHYGLEYDLHSMFKSESNVSLYYRTESLLYCYELFVICLLYTSDAADE